MNKIESTLLLENLLSKLGLKVRFALPTKLVVPVDGIYSVTFEHFLQVNGTTHAMVLPSVNSHFVTGQYVVSLKKGDVVKSRNSLHIYQI